MTYIGQKVYAGVCSLFCIHPFSVHFFSGKKH